MMTNALLKTADSDSTRGLVCRRCGCGHFEVVYTRAVSERRILRRRQCRYCGRRITTYEQSID